MLLRSLVLASFLLAPTFVPAQQEVTALKGNNAAAGQELEAIIIEARGFDDKNAFVDVMARAAMLVSFSDPTRAETMFLAIWKFTSDQTGGGFQKEQAKLRILKYLYPRNPKLARQLLNERVKSQDLSSPSGPMSRDDALNGKLASQLLDADPSAAAGLLERSMSVGPTPGNVSVLSRLREKDPLLSDYIASKTLDGLANQPSIVSLSGLFMMTAYAFPGPEAPIFSADAESSLLMLQYRYFITGRDLLISSLAETNEALAKDQHYREQDLQLRAAYQGQIAAILAALAPRIQPSLAAELNSIARKLASQVPANISQLTKMALAKLSGNAPSSDNPEESFVFSLSNGDFNEARKQLDLLNDERKKDIYAQLLLKNEARFLLAKSDVMGALTLIRKIQDPTTRLVSYLEALKAAYKKHDSNLGNIVLNEARLLIPQTDRNGLHLRALLAFGTKLINPETQADALEFLNSAVGTINALGKTSGEPRTAKTLAEATMQELNDPNSLLDAPEMDEAFSVLGLVDLERALALANRIEPKSVQLVARLSAIRGIIKRTSIEQNAPAKTRKPLPAPKQ
jgi:hypothetical protein